MPRCVVIRLPHRRGWSRRSPHPFGALPNRKGDTIMYVGIDVGTSMVKAAAFDSDGRELAVEARPVRLALHGGVVEQDMEEVYAAVVGVLEALTARVREPVELGGLTGQGDGGWLVGEG